MNASPTRLKLCSWSQRKQQFQYRDYLTMELILMAGNIWSQSVSTAFL